MRVDRSLRHRQMRLTSFVVYPIHQMPGLNTQSRTYFE
jgi:hypothetical protein